MIVVVAVLAGCAPSAVRPTLDDVHALGYYCDEGIKDNVPSGLTQWHCNGRPEGIGAVIDIDGNGSGVTEITLAVAEPEFQAVRDEFKRIVPGIRLVAATPGLVDTFDDWLGQQEVFPVGEIQVSTDCDDTQCLVTIGSAAGPLVPLPTPPS